MLVVRAYNGPGASVRRAPAVPGAHPAARPARLAGFNQLNWSSKDVTDWSGVPAPLHGPGEARAGSSTRAAASSGRCVAKIRFASEEPGVRGRRVRPAPAGTDRPSAAAAAPRQRRGGAHVRVLPEGLQVCAPAVGPVRQRRWPSALPAGAVPDRGRGRRRRRRASGGPAAAESCRAQRSAANQSSQSSRRRSRSSGTPSSRSSFRCGERARSAAGQVLVQDELHRVDKDAFMLAYADKIVREGRDRRFGRHHRTRRRSRWCATSA